MNIINLIQIIYPGQVEAGNINFRNPDGRILIANWDVPNIPKPTEDELEEMIPTYEDQFNLNLMRQKARLIIEKEVDRVAQSKEYSSAVSCASYQNSTNSQWALEAEAFIAWRDSCYQYVYGILDLVLNGQEPPSEEDFIAAIPVIQWP